MLRKTLFLIFAALLVALATSTRAQAWYCYHHSSYGGGYHYGGSGGGGGGGYHYGGYHYGGYGGGGAHYGYGRRW